MRRWLPAVLALVLVAVLVFLGYQAYTAYQGLQARVAALEAQVQGQGEALKALSERVARLEAEGFRTPAGPLSPPPAPEVPAPPAWPYVVGGLVLLLLPYRFLRLLRAPEKPKEAPEKAEEKSPSQAASPEGVEEARMLDEGAPPPPPEEPRKG